MIVTHDTTGCGRFKSFDNAHALSKSAIPLSFKKARSVRGQFKGDGALLKGRQNFASEARGLAEGSDDITTNAPVSPRFARSCSQFWFFRRVLGWLIVHELRKSNSPNRYRSST